MADDLQKRFLQQVTRRRRIRASPREVMVQLVRVLPV
jgi:hypothetical protein